MYSELYFELYSEPGPELGLPLFELIAELLGSDCASQRLEPELVSEHFAPGQLEPVQFGAEQLGLLG